MRTFIVFNQITAETIKLMLETNSIKLKGVVSLHEPLHMESILRIFENGDTLIIEGIHLFNGVSELYSALSLISNLFNGNFISLQQRLIKIDNGYINKDILEVISVGARIEEKCLKRAKDEEDNQAKIDSIMKSLKQLTITILEDNFKNQTINN